MLRQLLPNFPFQEPKGPKEKDSVYVWLKFILTLTAVCEDISLMVLQDADPELYMALCLTDLRSARLLLPIPILPSGGKTPEVLKRVRRA